MKASEQKIIKLPCATWTLEETTELMMLQHQLDLLNRKYHNLLPFGDEEHRISQPDMLLYNQLKERFILLEKTINIRIELEGVEQKLDQLIVHEK